MDQAAERARVAFYSRIVEAAAMVELVRDGHYMSELSEAEKARHAEARAGLEVLVNEQAEYQRVEFERLTRP